ncbi:MAG: hypothetical protein DME22_17030 [Verrucomicrobia bacterium]|nr:MAG: hypothetical protein DME22_17030 [Verrucomicrobiota bacterium]
MKVRACRLNSSGFTLIELVISAALMALILVSAYLCMSACVSTQKLIEPRFEAFQSARVAMAIMAADLRAACPLSKEFQFVGMHRTLGEVEADNLDFATHNYTPRRAREGDFCEVSFFLQPDRESGKFCLWRRRNPTIAPDPLSGGSRVEIARGLRGLRFEYYDGYEWYDTWGDAEGNGKKQSSLRDQPNLSGMPEAVRITLWFESNSGSQTATAPENEAPGPPLQFQTVARLNLAAASQRAASGGSSGNGFSDNSGQATPVTTNLGRN